MDISDFKGAFGDWQTFWQDTDLRYYNLIIDFAVKEGDIYQSLYRIIGWTKIPKDILLHVIDMSNYANEELAVKAGYWHCFRFNPALAAEGKDAFSLDSKEPTGDYQEFLDGEVRYNSLKRANPERAAKLFAQSEASAKARYEYLKKLGDLYMPVQTEE